MKKYRIHSEDARQYTIEREDGKRFSVAKSPLSKDAHERIKHFASGGEVDPPTFSSPDLATEKSVRHDGVLEIQQGGKRVRVAMNALTPAVRKKIEKMARGGVVKMAEGGEASLSNIDPSVYSDPQAVQQILAQQKQAEGMNAVGNTIGGWFKKTPRGMGPEAGGEIDTHSLPEMGIQPSPDAARPEGPQVPQTEAEAQSYIQANPELFRQPAEQKPTPGGLGAPNTQRDLQNAFALEQKSLQKQADLAEKHGMAHAAILADSEKRRQDIIADHDRQKTDFKDRLAAAQQAESEGKIDPNRSWNSRSTAGKVSAALGLVLGGLSSGIRGGPNVAMQILDNEAQRDIDAQVKNLDSAHNRVRELLEQGHSLDQAKSLALAEHQSSIATKLETLGAQYLGPEKQAQLGQQIAASREKSAMNVENVFHERTQIGLEREKLQTMRDVAANKMAYQQALKGIPDAKSIEAMEAVRSATDKSGLAKVLGAIPGVSHLPDVLPSTRAASASDTQILDSIMAVTGQKASSRNPQYKEWQKTVEDTHSLNPEIAKDAKNRIVQTIKAHVKAKRLGAPVPTSRPAAEEDVGD